jgi:hypothetical protein
MSDSWPTVLVAGQRGLSRVASPAMLAPPQPLHAWARVLPYLRTDQDGRSCSRAPSPLCGQTSKGLRANPYKVVRVHHREGAFRDASHALVPEQQTRQRREEPKQRTKGAADAVGLARLRDNGGYTSYREVLTSDANLYAAPLT